MYRLRLFPGFVFLRILAIACCVVFIFGALLWRNDTYSQEHLHTLEEQARLHDISRKDKSIRGRESKNWSDSVRHPDEEPVDVDEE